LIIARRQLPAEFYSAWSTRHTEAAAALDEREAKLDAVYDELEQQLELLGATAIEDKLQVIVN
jgi:phospholipid-translocating ATPase